MKKCSDCHILMDLKNFHKDIQRKDKKRSYCIECASKRKVKYIKQNPEKIRNTSLLRQYGITLKEYNAIFDRQNGWCAICKEVEFMVDPRTQKPRNLAVDHCHETGIVRGLLCSNCNKGLGCFRDSIELFKEAQRYIYLSNIPAQRSGAAKV